MHFSCSICKEVILPNAKADVTRCGHVFHHDCLAEWLKSAKSCPECRSNATHVTRLYLDYVTDDRVDISEEESGESLKLKLDSLKCQMRMNAMETKNLSEKYKKAKLQNLGLRKEIRNLEDEKVTHITAIHSLQDQVTYYHTEVENKEKLEAEINTLKDRIQTMENLQAVLSGTRSDVEEILQNENNIESLAIFTASLKMSLIETGRKMKSSESKVKQLKTELMLSKKKQAQLEISNKELRLQIDTIKDAWQKDKSTWESQKEFLTASINKFHEGNGSSDKHADLVVRLINESPMPMPRKSSGDIGDISSFDTTTVEEKVNIIRSSDSPLQVKSSSMMGIDFTKLARTNKTFFKTPVKQEETIKFSKPTSEFMYNGLGGSSKEDIFPSPKSTTKPIRGIKRHQTVSLSSRKSKKLNAFSTKH